MKETILYHGIPIVGRMPLFTAGNRQAIRDDRKGQTRRLMIEQPSCDLDGAYFDAYDGGPQWNWWLPDGRMRNGHDIIHCPYGKVGDVRCMCEPLVRGLDGMTYYGDVVDTRPLCITQAISLITGKPIPWRWKREYLASLHMPTEAARTVRRTTGIRVEKLQEISEEDAIAEGIDMTPHGTGFPLPPITQFSLLWDSINAKHSCSWDVPQMVWMYAFEKLEV